MFIDDFIWLPIILDKVEVKHQVSQDEAEEIFFNKPRYRFVELGHQKGEDVYSVTGQTDAGRYLIVFFYLQIVQHRLDYKCERYGQKGTQAL